MLRLPRPLAIPLVGLLGGVLGALLFSALGGVVAGNESCDVNLDGLDGIGLLLAKPMFDGRLGSILGLVVGFAIAAAATFSGKRTLMAVEAGVIIAVVAGGDGPFPLLGSVSLNGASHLQCNSAATLGGFVGGSMGTLVGIFLASGILSRRLVLGAVAAVGAIAVPFGFFLGEIIGWEN